MRVLDIVQRDPILDDAPGLKAVVYFFKINRIPLQKPPTTLNENFVQTGLSALLQKHVQPNLSPKSFRSHGRAS